MDRGKIFLLEEASHVLRFVKTIGSGKRSEIVADVRSSVLGFRRIVELFGKGVSGPKVGDSRGTQVGLDLFNP